MKLLEAILRYEKVRRPKWVKGGYLYLDDGQFFNEDGTPASLILDWIAKEDWEEYREPETNFTTLAEEAQNFISNAARPHLVAHHIPDTTKKVGWKKFTDGKPTDIRFWIRQIGGSRTQPTPIEAQCSASGLLYIDINHCFKGGDQRLFLDQSQYEWMEIPE